jgi:hypothetical protein
MTPRGEVPVGRIDHELTSIAVNVKTTLALPDPSVIFPASV